MARIFLNGFNNKSWFTIVELVMVILILAILGTISFLSYGDSVLDARNATRKTDMGEMKIRLRGAKQKLGYFTVPKTPFSLTNSGLVAVSQGTSDSIEMWNGSSLRADPRTGKAYVYSTTTNRQSYQIAMTIEGTSTNSAYVDGDYIPLTPDVFPSLVIAMSTTGNVEIRDTFGAGSTNRLKFIVNNGTYNLPYNMTGQPVATATTFNSIVTQSNVLIPQSSNYTDCRSIYEWGKSLWSGNYLVVTSTGAIATVPCVMSPPSY